MKRLTVRSAVYNNGKYDVINCMVCGVELKDVFDRLATIEDILGDDYDLDRLRELVEADRDGRCVVLPVQPGDKVYQQNGTSIYSFGAVLMKAGRNSQKRQPSSLMQLSKCIV